MPKSTSEYDRRMVLAGGLAGLSVLGSASAASAAPAKTGRDGSRLQFAGNAPLNADVAKHIDEAPALMSALASKFAPHAAELADQKSYWLALNGWITDHLSGPIMEGKASLKDVREGAWAAYATAYWGGLELRRNWGMPPVIERLNIKIPPPFTPVQQGFAIILAPRFAALAGGGDECLKILPKLLHDNAPTGALRSTAYNAGCQVLLTEDPPIGQRRPHRAPRPSAVRINPRDFMRVDYQWDVPMYLKVWRSAFERAVTANPEAYEKIIVGEPGQKDLREIWKEGVGYGNTTWGGDASDKWTDGYFDDALRWSTVVNFGLEAVSLAAFVALINQDKEAAKRAVMGNILYAGMTSGWLIGLLDLEGRPPSATRA